MAGAEPVVLYRDERFVAVDKPSGWLVVPGRGARAEEQTLARYVSAREGIARLWPVHRLDRETSGVVLFALEEGAHRVACGAFAGRRARKRYLALVEGVPAPARGEVRLPLAPDPRRRHRGGMVVDETRGKASHTDYEVLRTLREGRVALVAASPRTGRTHQIRVHLAALGHPVLQDRRYGRVDESLPFGRLALHAESLDIPALALSLHAPLPPELQAFVTAAGGSGSV